MNKPHAEGRVNHICTEEHRRRSLSRIESLSCAEEPGTWDEETRNFYKHFNLNHGDHRDRCTHTQGHLDINMTLTIIHRKHGAEQTI